MGHLKIYQSSAGSGKTYTLVKEYLSLIFKAPAFLRNTLAITFTNDATGEMKERIIHALWSLSKQENETLQKDLAKGFPENFDFKKAAALLLQQILHHYGDFSISTIDSFFLNITKSVSHELGLSGKYDVDMNRDAAIDFIVSNTLLAIGDDAQLTNWLEEFAYQRMEEEKAWNMQSELKKIAGELFKDDYRKLNDKYARPVSLSTLLQMRKNVQHFRAQLKAEALKFFEISHSAGMELSDFSYGRSGFAGTIKKLSEGGFPEGYQFGTRFIQACSNGKLFAKSSTINFANDTSLANDLLQVMRRIKIIYDENIETYLSEGEVLKMIYLAGVLQHLDRELSNYRKEKQVMLISDVNMLLSNFIVANDTPFIYEKVGNSYQNFLIDEFQDTSASQWLNMLPLLKNSVSSNHQVLTVGDVKQSIYRWRGGEMKLLLHDVEKQLQPLSTKTDKIVLGANYRSLPSIIQFNNALFTHVHDIIPSDESTDDLLSTAYHPLNVKQDEIRKGTAGFVQLECLNEQSALSDFNYPDGISERKKVVLGKVLLFIHKQFSLGYLPADIALLVRQNHEGKLLADFLMRNGIQRINARDSLLIQSSPTVSFLINVFKFLVDENNEVARYHIRWFCKTAKVLQDEEIATDFFAKRTYLLNLALHEIFCQCLLHFRFNQKPDAFIQRLEDLVIEKIADGIGDVKQFVAWWDEEIVRLKIAVQAPFSEEAVNIMTIHRSKGLQFPIVVVPFCDWNLKSSKGLIWTHSSQQPFDQLGVFPLALTSTLDKTIFRDAYTKESNEKKLEEINAMYVAFTRAEEKLYVLLKEKAENKLSTVGDVVRYALSHVSDVKNIFERQGERLYVLGADEPKQPLKNKPLERLPDDGSMELLHNYPVNDLFSHIGFKIKKYSDEHDRKHFGICAHDLLARFYKPEDRENILLSIATLNFSIQDMKKLHNEISQAIDVLLAEKWHSNFFEIKNEVEIVAVGQQFLRPDRLMIRNNEAIIVDYKTGTRNSVYGEQVSTYAQVLKEMGMHKVSGYLLYLEECILQQVF